MFLFLPLFLLLPIFLLSFPPYPGVPWRLRLILSFCYAGLFSSRKWLPSSLTVVWKELLSFHLPSEWDCSFFSLTDAIHDIGERKEGGLCWRFEHKDEEDDETNKTRESNQLGPPTVGSDWGASFGHWRRCEANQDVKHKWVILVPERNWCTRVFNDWNWP